MGEFSSDNIKVSFKRIFSPSPKYSLGDRVKTTFYTEGEIVEVRRDPNLDGYVYLIDEGDKKELYHQSAILGYANKKQEQTELSKYL